jgi:sugar phosphate isomerase/epimerase
MIIACSTLCFAKLPLDEALQTIRRLSFTKADLAIHEEGPHLRPSEVVADVAKVSQKLKASTLGFAAFHVNLGDQDTPMVRGQLRAILRLARLLAVPLISVPAAAAGSDLNHDVLRLKEWSQFARTEGVMLCIETRAGTLTADPLGALELCKRVPTIGITLDPSHYHVRPHAGANYDQLIPHVRHVRLRDTGHRPEEFQVRVGQGELDFGRITGMLERCAYDRALTVDIVDVADSPFPVEPEVRKLMYLLESLI